MKHPKTPSSTEVLNAVKDLPTCGTVAQNQQNGMLYLDLNDDWIFNALEVLQDSGYIRPPFFVYPPFPVGAHIKIVTKREAEDYELFGEKGRDVSHLIGKTVDFSLLTAHVSYPRIKKYGIEAKYKIRVESPELSRIRKELTGLSTGPNNGHFVILVGVRLEASLNGEFEEQLGPDEKHEDDDEDDDTNFFDPAIDYIDY